MIKGPNPRSAFDLIAEVGLYDTIFTDPTQDLNYTPETALWPRAYILLDEFIRGESHQKIKQTLLPDTESRHSAWLLTAFVPWFDGPYTDQISVEMSTDCSQIQTFTRHISILDTKAQKSLLDHAKVSQNQSTPYSVEVAFAGFKEFVRFPFPVDGTQIRLRIARKSHYIEVIRMCLCISS